jgi:hypothetical protein
VGSDERPAVCFESKRRRSRSFVLAEIVAKIWAATRIGNSEPKKEFVVIRQRSRFDCEIVHNRNA